VDFSNLPQEGVDEAVKILNIILFMKQEMPWVLIKTIDEIKTLS
jgi:hypothetical protein